MRVHGVGFAGLVHEGHMQGLAFLAPDERSQDSQVLVRLAALDWLAERVVLVLTEHGLPVHGGTRASLASGGGRKGDLLSNTERCLAEEGKRTYCLTQKGVRQRKESRLTVYRRKASGRARKGDVLSNIERRLTEEGKETNCMSNTERRLAEGGKETYCLTQKGVWQRKETRLTV